MSSSTRFYLTDFDFRKVIDIVMDIVPLFHDSLIHLIRGFITGILQSQVDHGVL